MVTEFEGNANSNDIKLAGFLYKKVGSRQVISVKYTVQ